MQLVLADSDRNAMAVADDFSLDMAVGDDENDFLLTLPDSAPLLSDGCFVYAPGTDWGGVVDSLSSEGSRTGPALSYKGRTWSGVLANRIVVPPSGSSHFKSSGEANACIRALIAHLGLGGLFSTPMGDSGIEVDYEWDRFCDAWHGLLECLGSSGAKPSMRWSGGYVEISAEPSRAYGTMPGEEAFVSLTRDYRPVNHLVCAGTGEMEDREVVHFYADAQGNVSHVQTLFGVDEVAALYDYTNADSAELEKQGAKKLADYQVQGQADVSIPDGSVRLDAGDYVTGRETRFGIEVTVPVVKKIARVSRGVEAVEYECGQAESTRSLSSTSESSGGGGGGASYSAGDGISISGNVISADVTDDDIARIDGDIEEARKAASDASASAGAAVKSVEGSSPISASIDRSDMSVVVSHAASGVSAGSYGPMDDLEPSWGDTVTVSPWVSVDAGGHVTQAAVRSMRIPDSAASQSAPGLMSAADKKALDSAPERYADKGHTHQYAGSDEAGGAADSAKKLETARTITISGAVNGSARFDGSSDVTITVSGNSEAAGFLAAHPPGTYWETSADEDPASTYGGTWERVFSAGRGRLWHRLS